MRISVSRPSRRKKLGIYPSRQSNTRASRQLDPRSPRAFAATGTWSDFACSASRHIHGSASRCRVLFVVMVADSDDSSSRKRFLTARTARKMCNLALADPGIQRFSMVNQRFRLPISPMISAAGVAVAGPGSARPTGAAKCTSRDAAGEVFAESVDTVRSGRTLSRARASGAAMCIAPVRSAMDSMCKENLGISSFF